MDAEKLLVQENPPTRREWCMLKQSVKNWTLYALVDCQAVEVQYIQLKPYTAIQLAFDAGDNAGEDTILGVGFSKVCHPDVYDTAVGYRIARIRAVRMIVKQLLDAQPGECDLKVALAYDVLVAKWDRYRDAVEDILACAQAEAERAAFEDAEVGVDLAEEGGDKSIDTILVSTAPPFVQMRG